MNLRDAYKIITWDINSKYFDVNFFGKKNDDGRGAKVRLTANGVVVTPTTEQLRLYCKKQDGTKVYLDGVIENGLFVLDFNNQIYAVPGNVQAELHLTTDCKTVASPTFYIPVDDNLVDGAIESSDEYVALTNMINDVDGVKAQLAQSATKDEVQTVNARLDNIITPNGDASLTEVVDLRLKADGTLATSAGAAVREQFANVVSSVQTGNLAKNITLENGTIDATNGNDASSTTRVRSKKTNFNVPIYISSASNIVVTIWFYNNLGAYIGNYPLSGSIRIEKGVNFRIVARYSNDAVIGVDVVREALQITAKEPDAYDIMRGLDWSYGNIDTNTGAFVANTDSTRIVSSIFFAPKGMIFTNASATKTLRLYQYGSQTGGVDNFLKRGTISVTGGTTYENSSDSWIRIVGLQDSGAITRVYSFFNNVYGTYTIPAPQTKLICFDGDSITYGTNLANVKDAYPYVMALNLKCAIENKAIGGSTIAVKESSPTERTPLSTRYTELNPNAKGIFMAAGSNDWFYEWTPVGTMADRTVYTFYGALHVLMSGLKNRYPDIPIVFFTPIQRYQGGTFAISPSAKNSYGYTLRQYCNIIKEVADDYAIHVIDMNVGCGLCPWLPIHQAMYFDIDNVAGWGTGVHVHPNKLAQQRMADFATSQTKALLGWD